MHQSPLCKASGCKLAALSCAAVRKGPVVQRHWHAGQHSFTHLDEVRKVAEEGSSARSVHICMANGGGGGRAASDSFCKLPSVSNAVRPLKRHTLGCCPATGPDLVPLQPAPTCSAVVISRLPVIIPLER